MPRGDDRSDAGNFHWGVRLWQIASKPPCSASVTACRCRHGHLRPHQILAVAFALATAGSLNPNDYEQYGQDANGNRTSGRRRDGSTRTFACDAPNRVIRKLVPNPAGRPSANCYSLTNDTNDVCYGYDLRGRPTDARFGSLNGQGIANALTGSIG